MNKRLKKKAKKVNKQPKILVNYIVPSSIQKKVLLPAT
jgi:hypothetical protein